MTTLTLAVNCLPTDPTSPAAIAGPSAHSAACQRDAQNNTLAALAFSKSTPEVGSTARDSSALPRDDQALLWRSTFVDVPLILEAIPKAPETIVTPPRPTLESIQGPTVSEAASAEARPRSLSDDGALLTPLRKLKLSLRLPSLHRLASTSQLSPKSVRFASRLEKVKMFDGKDSPSAVSLQNSPAGSPKYDFPVDDYFSFRSGFSDLGVSDDDSDTEYLALRDRHYKIASSNFVPPQNIYDKRSSPVYLQSAMLTSDKKLLTLLVMCQNLAYEKQLSIKLTYNNWNSLVTYKSATYVKSFPSVNFDQFRFVIPFANLPTSITTQFCICYVVGNDTFWDNNNSKNYCFQLEAVKKQNSTSIALKTLKNDSFSYKPPVFSSSGRLDTRPKLASTTSASSYSELVSKLMSIKVGDERPKMARSASALTIKPRYSQTYRNKHASEMESATATANRAFGWGLEKSGLSSNSFTAGAKPSVATRPDPEVPGASSSSGKSTLPGAPSAALDAGSEASNGAVMKQVEVSAPSTQTVSAKGPISGQLMKEMLYLDLIQNYCFNGAAKVDRPCGMLGSFNVEFGIYNSSGNSSSASLQSDYATPASAFQSWSDPFSI